MTFSLAAVILAGNFNKDLGHNGVASFIRPDAQFGASQYLWRRADHSGIINDLYKYYQVEGMTMPYTWDNYYREITKEHLDLLPAEERVKGLPAKERLKGLPAEAF